MVALVAKGAHPDLGLEVDPAVRVQDPRAALAAHGLVGEERQVLDRLEWGVHAAEWYNHARGLEAGGGPHVPAETHPIRSLNLVEVSHRGRRQRERRTESKKGAWHSVARAVEGG